MEPYVSPLVDELEDFEAGLEEAHFALDSMISMNSMTIRPIMLPIRAVRLRCSMIVRHR